jgi:hypothetical protein
VSQQARPPVAGLSFAAARANPPQLLGRLIKEPYTGRSPGS